MRAKFFEEDHRERFSASSVRIRHFQDGGLAHGTVETEHLKLSLLASDTVVPPGSRVTLILEIHMKPRMHVYAPGVHGGYKPISWELKESAAWLAHPIVFPVARMLHLKAIQEKVPVYDRRIRLVRDVTVGQAREIAADGELRYQACDDRVCYPPQAVPLRWKFAVDRHDTRRAPEGLRRPENRSSAR